MKARVTIQFNSAYALSSLLKQPSAKFTFCTRTSGLTARMEINGLSSSESRMLMASRTATIFLGEHRSRWVIFSTTRILLLSNTSINWMKRDRNHISFLTSFMKPSWLLTCSLSIPFLIFKSWLKMKFLTIRKANLSALAAGTPNAAMTRPSSTPTWPLVSFTPSSGLISCSGRPKVNRNTRMIIGTTRMDRRRNHRGQQQIFFDLQWLGPSSTT